MMTMKLWIAQWAPPYEEGTVYGVFSTADKGKRAVEEAQGLVGKIRWRMDADGDWTNKDPVPDVGDLDLWVTAVWLDSGEGSGL